MTPNEKRPLLPLLGRRNEQFLVLSGAPWAVFVKPDHCLVIDPSGKQIGRLQRVVRESLTMGVKPPKGAIVLFDGTGTEQFTRAEMTDDGLLAQGADIKPLFHDFDMHLEFLVPFVPEGRGQARGNSGVYLQSSYEVQVLDSFALEPRANDCGALYRFRPPDVNVCFPPLTWQTYDIVFTSPRWNADGTKRGSGRVTVWLNGVKVQDNVELPSQTGNGKEDGLALAPIRLQDHKNPVRYRNIWVIDRGIAPPQSFPIFRDLKKEAAEKAAKEAAVKKAAEEAARKKAAEEAARKKAEEEKARMEAAKKAAADKVAADKVAAAKKAAEEAARMKAEKEVAEKKAREAAAKKAAADKAAAEKKAAEEAARMKAEKEAAEKKAREEAAKKAAKEAATKN